MDDAAVANIVSELEAVRQAVGRSIAVAVDGPSGAGKTDLAFRLAQTVPASFVLQTDSFHVPLSCAYRMIPAHGEVGAMIDWRRFRETALRPLRENQTFLVDWIDPFSGQLEATHEIGPDTVVLCDGTFSARPELWDFYDYRILVQESDEVSRSRRRARDTDRGEAWLAYVERVWVPDERRHLTSVDPQRFDAVLGPRS